MKYIIVTFVILFIIGFVFLVGCVKRDATNEVERILRGEPSSQQSTTPPTKPVKKARYKVTHYCYIPPNVYLAVRVVDYPQSQRVDLQTEDGTQYTLYGTIAIEYL